MLVFKNDSHSLWFALWVLWSSYVLQTNAAFTFYFCLSLSPATLRSQTPLAFIGWGHSQKEKAMPAACGWFFLLSCSLCCHVPVLWQVPKILTISEFKVPTSIDNDWESTHFYDLKDCWWQQPLKIVWMSLYCGYVSWQPCLRIYGNHVKHVASEAMVSAWQDNQWKKNMMCWHWMDFRWQQALKIAWTSLYFGYVFRQSFSNAYTNHKEASIS